LIIRNKASREKPNKDVSLYWNLDGIEVEDNQ
jgi:hypothetical protein